MATGESGVLASIQGALQRHVRAEELRRHSRLLMQPHANWEEFLTPAPTAIAILGQLIAVSSAGDFPLDQHCPGRHFQHIKYPESFRACLMQVSNRGWCIFNLAHRNMDQIRLHSQSVPEHTRAAVRTLLQGDGPLLARLLPRQLGSIRTVAQECGRLASEVEGAFLGITDLLHELLEACTGAQGALRAEAQEASRALEEAGRRRARAEEERRRAEEYLARMSREVDEAQQGYRSAVERAPSEWGVVGMLAVENSINALGSLVSGFMSVVTADPVSLSATVVESLANVGNAVAERVRSKGPAAAAATAPAHGPLSGRLLTSCTRLMLAAVRLQELLTPEGGLDPTAPLAPAASRAQRIFLEVQEELEEEEGEGDGPREAALALCHRGLGLCQQLEKVGQSASPGEEQLERAAARIADLYGKVLKFSAGCTASGSPLLPAGAPNLSRAAGPQDPEDKSLVQTLVTQARLRVENAKAQLESTRREYRHSFEGLKQSNRELEEIVRQMAQCQVTEVDLGTTLKMLAQGMEALGRVREQWTKMIRFFEMVSNLIQVCLSKSLQMFAEQSEDVQGLHNYGSQQLVRDLIYTQAFQASNISCLVHTISKTYVDVSSSFLMERVTRLGRLITLDPEDPAFLSERQLLQQGCEDARAMIMERVLSSRQEFEGQVQQRIEAIESDLKSALPPVSADEQRDIESSLRQPPHHIFRELCHQEEEQWA